MAWGCVISANHKKRNAETAKCGSKGKGQAAAGQERAGNDLVIHAVHLCGPEVPRRLQVWTDGSYAELEHGVHEPMG